MPPKGKKATTTKQTPVETETKPLYDVLQQAATNDDDGDANCYEDEEVEEYIEEVIIDEKEEVVEELIVFRIKELQGMARDSLESLGEKANLDADTILDESKIAIRNFDTSKPLLTLSNGLVLEGKWIETSENLAVVGIDERQQQKSNYNSSSSSSKKPNGDDANNQSREDTVRNNTSSSSTTKNSFANFAQRQTWAPTLSQRIRADNSSNRKNEDVNDGEEKSSPNKRTEYFVSSSGTPTRMAVFTISPEETIRRELMVHED